ncbi:MAG: HD domain-containing phosphohydrolase [Thermoleophilia bacterium]
MSFLTRFSLLGLAVTLIVGAAMAFAVAHQLTENEIEQLSRITARRLTTVVQAATAEPDFDAPWSGERLDAMDALLLSELRGTGVVRVKIWSLDGTILYSDERKLVGRRFDVTDDLERARSGEVSGELSSLQDPENQMEAEEYGELLEVYVPVRGSDAQVVGVFEVYRDAGRLEANISSMERRVWVGAGLAFLLVYLALFGLASQASRRLIAAEREARRRMEETLLLDRVLTAANAGPDPRTTMRMVCRELALTLSAPRCGALWPRGEEEMVLTEWTAPAADHRTAKHPPEGADRSSSGHLPGTPGSEGDVPAWKEALRTGGPVVVENASESPSAGALRQRFQENGTASALFLPLPLEGRRGGALWVETDSPRVWSEADLTLARKVAAAADVAIDNAVLLEELRTSNAELGAAYESTIEGWARALDLRDRETEGHSRRVTELTVALLRGAGCSEAELVHARRGALLHDIGKMGVPDTILLKPGPLTDEEWEIMRLHPDYARGMLDPIPHLRPALDIPYCHHERWDGGGYPRGLHGEDIPLAARVFAVVDVWDALLSDRPYRPAWPEERVLEYLESLGDTHFDPYALKLFTDHRAEAGSASTNGSEGSARSPGGSSSR